MNTKIKNVSPYLIIILGIFLLIFQGQPEIAGVCLLLGIVMVIERIWPEKWEADKFREDNI